METTSTNVENVVIIGGGPTGLAAAVYNARANLSPLLFSGMPYGGQLMLTSDVENYPGFHSILGPELIEKMREHAKKFGAKIIDQNVIKVDFSKSPFTIYVDGLMGPAATFPPASAPPTNVGVRAARPSKSEGRSGIGSPSSRVTHQTVYRAKAVIIATGASALWLGLESEQRLRGKGVSACAVCDGFFFRDKEVAVVGGGDTAMEEALFLTKFATKVFIIHRRDKFRASKIMQERVLANPKIEVVWSTEVEEVLGENKVEGIRLKSKKLEGGSKKEDEEVGRRNNLTSNLNNPTSTFLPPTSKTLPVQGLFVAIGHKPDTEIFKGQIEMDERGYIYTSGRVAYEARKLGKGKEASLGKEGGLGEEKNTNFLTSQPNRLPNPNLFDFAYQYVTSVPGVFAAGDCVDYVYRQAGTAVGMGIAAALEAEKWLESVAQM